MFERDRNPPEKFSTTPDLETTEFVAYEKLDKSLEKRLKRRSRMPIKVGAVALAFATVGSVYWADVEENRNERAEAKVSINVVGEAIDDANSDKATLFIDGFNTYDADYLTKSIGDAARQVADGEQWSLSYNNAILNREQIYETIIETAEERGIESISIAGYSMGGIIAVEAASDVVANSSIEVNTFTMMHTPDGTEGLQTKPKNELSFLQDLVKWFPGAIDSTYVRFFGELYSYKDLYTKGEFKDWDITHNAKVISDNIGRFSRTFNSLWPKVNNPKGTSLQLMLEQGYKIDHFSMKNELERITAEGDSKQMPVGLYLSMENDSTVKNQETADSFTVSTHETGIKFHKYTVPDAVHSQYYKTIDEYMQAFDRVSGVMARDVEEEKEKHEAYLAYQDEISILAEEQ